MPHQTVFSKGLTMSLHIPEKYKEPYRILSIDPGSNSLGVASLTIDPVSELIINIQAFTVHVEYLYKTDYCESDEDNPRINRMLKIQYEISKILDFYRPKLVVCESPFFNRLRPGAFAPLVEVMHTLRLAVLNYGCLVPFYTIEPSIIKKAVGASHIGDKNAVNKAVKEIDEIVVATPFSLDLLDEHAIDAIAIGYSYQNWQRQHAI